MFDLRGNFKIAIFVTWFDVKSISYYIFSWILRGLRVQGNCAIFWSSWSILIRIKTSGFTRQPTCRTTLFLRNEFWKFFGQIKLKTSLKTQKRPLDQLYWTKLALELALFAIFQVIKFWKLGKRKVIGKGYKNSIERFLNMNSFPKRTLFPRSIMNIIMSVIFLKDTQILYCFCSCLDSYSLSITYRPNIKIVLFCWQINHIL